MTVYLFSRLLEAGADVNHMNYEGFSALMLAARSGAAVNQLSVPMEYCFNTPLTEAILFHQADIVKILLQHGADVNQMPPGGHSPLHMAAAVLKESTEWTRSS